MQLPMSVSAAASLPTSELTSVAAIQKVLPGSILETARGCEESAALFEAWPLARRIVGI